ncbi:hypothetical protein DFH09DRAFT_1379923 [Mycena vulgaris]|nr:hypothetical protein DFH09DRAFT_1379923 [Mycena vulgaris]
MWADRCVRRTAGRRGQIKEAESPISCTFGGKFRSTVTLRAAAQKDSVIIEAWRTLRVAIQCDVVRTIQDALFFIAQPQVVQMGALFTPYLSPASGTIIQRGQNFVGRRPANTVDSQFIELCDEDAFDEATAEDISDTESDSDLHPIIITTKQSGSFVPAIPSRTRPRTLVYDIIYSIVEELVSLPSNIDVLRLEAHDDVPPLSLEEQHQTLAQLRRLCPPCGRCSLGPRPVIGREWILITALFPVIVLHVKRLDYDAAAGVIKLAKHVAFGPELEIGGDVLAPTATAAGRKPVRYNLFAGASPLFRFHSNNRIHIHRAACGWARIDDADVRAEDAFGVEHEREEGRCAYLLFYRRVR